MNPELDFFGWLEDYFAASSERFWTMIQRNEEFSDRLEQIARDWLG